MWSVVNTTLISMRIHNVWLSFLNYSSAPHKYSTSDLEEVWLSTEGWCNSKSLKTKVITLGKKKIFKLCLMSIIFFPFWGHCFPFFSRALFFWFFPFRGPCFPFFQGIVFPIFSLLRTLFFPIFRGWCSMLRGVVCCGHFLSANAPRNRLLLQYTHPTVTIHTASCATFYWAET